MCTEKLGTFLWMSFGTGLPEMPSPEADRLPYMLKKELDELNFLE
jgi:hypothetical protein